MEIKDRIRMIMEREKVPPRVFAETIGVQQSTLSHILNDRSKAESGSSDEKFTKPNLNGCYIVMVQKIFTSLF